MGASGLNVIANGIRRSVAVFFILTLLFQLVSCDDYGVIYTESIEDYNTEEYPVKSTVFLETIPDSATVISFSYYDYWHESHEIYIELKFSAESELKEYINSIKDHAESYLINATKPSNGEWFAEVESPYDSNYVELISLSHSTWQNDKRFVGYSIEKRDSVEHSGYYTQYVCNYQIISYSLEDLTVIQSSTQGYFEYFEEAYVPKYFRRFNIPTDKELERRYYVEY